MIPNTQWNKCKNQIILVKLPRDSIPLLILYRPFVYRKLPGISDKIRIQKHQKGSFDGFLNPMTLVKHKVNIKLLLWLE